MNKHNPFETDQKPDPVRISLTSRMWLLFACVDIARAKKSGNDVWILKIIGQQIFLIFLVLFGLQGYAIYSISEADWRIAAGIAFVTASLVISIDRAFLAQDYETEGEMDEMRDQHPERVKFLWLKRIGFGLLRAMIAFFLSYAFATIAVLGLVSDEIDTYLIQYERKRNAAGYALLTKFDEQQILDLGMLREREAAQLSQIEESRRLLDALAASPPSLPELTETSDSPQISSLSQQRDSLSAEIRRLNADASRFEACANAEATGDVSDSCPEVIPSGVPTCGPKCREWLRRAGSSRETASGIQTQVADINRQISKLNEDLQQTTQSLSQQKMAVYEQNVGAYQSAISNQNATIDNMTAQLSLTRKQIANFEATLQDRRLEYRTNLEAENLIADTGHGGFARSLRAWSDVVNNELNNPDAQHLLNIAKWSIVILELSVILSRLLTATPTYARATFREAEKRRRGI